MVQAQGNLGHGRGEYPGRKTALESDRRACSLEEKGASYEEQSIQVKHKTVVRQSRQRARTVIGSITTRKVRRN